METRSLSRAPKLSGTAADSGASRCLEGSPRAGEDGGAGPAGFEAPLLPDTVSLCLPATHPTSSAWVGSTL